MSTDIVILDIEGTVCPITFVKTTLFPYFLTKLPSLLSEISFPLQADTSDPIVEVLSKLPADINKSYDSILLYLTKLVENDIKEPVLKELQGLVWKQGYKGGELLSPIYQDSVKFIKGYPDGDKKVYIYSSGSIKAQKLLFGHVRDKDGSVDLNGCLSGYFDITTAGHKVVASSYSKILEEIGYDDKPDRVLFLSDNVNEVKAALKAGMKSSIVVRPGNPPLTEEDRSTYDIIESLDELML